MLHGNDVGSYQSGWSPAKGDGFGIAKVSQGNWYLNPRYGDQLAAIRHAGIPAGHYLFMESQNVAQQAGFFLSHAHILPGDFIEVDWEPWGGSTPSSGLKSALIRELQRRAPTTSVGLYCNRGMWYGSDRFDGDHLWIASPGSLPVGIPWTFWQYSWNPIDANWARFASVAALRAFMTKGSKPTPAPPPPPPPPAPPDLLGMTHTVGPL